MFLRWAHSTHCVLEDRQARCRAGQGRRQVFLLGLTIGFVTVCLTVGTEHAILQVNQCIKHVAKTGREAAQRESHIWKAQAPAASVHFSVSQLSKSAVHRMVGAPNWVWRRDRHLRAAF